MEKVCKWRGVGRVEKVGRVERCGEGGESEEGGEGEEGRSPPLGTFSASYTLCVSIHRLSF